MKKISLGLTVAFFILSGCRPKENLIQSSTEALNTSLELQKDFNSLPIDSCLVEVTKNFKAGESKSIGSSALAQCLPAKRVGFKGRLDVENSVSKLKPISIALMVDNSVSLKVTDPGNKRFEAIDAFLDQVNKVFAQNLSILRLQVVFFSYCGTKRFRLKDAGSMQALKAAISNGVPKTPDGATNYLDALSQTRDWIEQAPDSEAHVVLFSDGMPFTLSPKIPASCTLTVEKVASQHIESAELKGCASSDTGASCREPGVDDVGFSARTRPAWDDPTNYAVGMRDHVNAFAELSSMPQVKKVDTVFLNGGCYEERSASAQGDSKRAASFRYLCGTLAPEFFTKISTGKNYEIRNAENLKSALLNVSETIVKQVGFQKVTATVDGEKLVGKSYKQSTEKDSYDFELPSKSLNALQGRAAVEAYESQTDTKGVSVSIDYNFQKPTGIAACADFAVSGAATSGTENVQLVTATKEGYRITCRLPKTPQGCRTQSGVLVADGNKETAPGYSQNHVANGRKCTEVVSPRTRTCRDGKWDDEWQGGPFTTCIEDGPAACGTHADGTEWAGDVRYYERSQVGANETCRGETDKLRCSNGVVTTVFKTSYKATTCVTETHKNCGTTPHGSTELTSCYNTASATAPAKCVPFKRTCVEGVFQPASCPFTTCVESELKCRDAQGNQVSVGSQQSRTRSRVAQVPYGGRCEAEVQVRRCSQNGIWDAWSGSFLYESCFEQSAPVVPPPAPVPNVDPVPPVIPAPVPPEPIVPIQVPVVPESEVSGELMPN